MSLQKLLDTFVPVTSIRPTRSRQRRGTKAIDELRADPRVKWVDDDRAVGGGILVTLRQGWTFSAGEDVRVESADTAAEAARIIRKAARFGGPYYE